MNTLFEQSVCNYEIQGDYQLPCIATKKQNELHIGVWANRHRQYLKQHHRIRYYNLLTTERLYPYLADIEEQAQTMFSQLVKSFAEKENITEKLKSDNPMLSELFRYNIIYVSPSPFRFWFISIFKNIFVLGVVRFFY